MHTTARNATLADLAQLLQDQQTRKHDVVAPASTLSFTGGQLTVDGAEAELTAEGVTTVDGTYTPTAVFDEGLAEKLGVPLPYVRRMRAERPDLYDANANGWLHGGTTIGGDDLPNVYKADDRSFLVRLFRGGGGDQGIARAMLSDRYRVVDHLDVLTAALAGVRDTGADVTISGCDLTERRMAVRIEAQGITAMAQDLLAGYRSPFADPAVDAQRQHWQGVAAREGQGYEPGTEPIVWAGLVITNSETGGGAFTITPRMVVKVCRNGLTITQDALRAVHLGGKLDEGVVRWSDDTQQKNLELVTARTRDAVATFLDRDYLQTTVARLEAQAGHRLDDPAEQVKDVTKRLGFTEGQSAGVLAHFIQGGQTTAGGLMQAVTSYAQTVGDPDAAQDVEAAAVKALDLAAAL